MTIIAIIIKAWLRYDISIYAYAHSIHIASCLHHMAIVAINNKELASYINCYLLKVAAKTMQYN